MIASYPPLPADAVWRMLGYGWMYALAFVLLALLNFRKREI